MPPFDLLNIIVASVTGGVVFLYIIIAAIIHHSFKVKLQSGNGLQIYKDTAKRSETSAIDNRKRIYYTEEPCILVVNQYNQFEEQRNTDNIEYFKFVSRKHALRFRRFLRVMAIIFFILSLIILLLSAGLLIAQFFTTDDIRTMGFLAEIPQIVDLIMNYNTLIISFGVVLISLVTFRLISASLRTYKTCEPFYLERLNMDEVARAFEPIKIKVKVNAKNS